MLAIAKSSLPNAEVRDGHVKLLSVPKGAMAALLWRFQGKIAPISLREGTRYVRALDYSPTGSHLAVTVDDTIELWDVQNKNLEAILNEAKLTFEHVVKTTIFLSDMNLFASVNEIYGSYFKGDFPARETVAVKGLPKGVNVEISMIATVAL